MENIELGEGSTLLDPSDFEKSQTPPESVEAPKTPQKPQPPKVNLWEKGKQQGLKDAERNFKERLAQLGFSDPDNFEAELQMIRELANAGKGTNEEKNIVKAFKEKLEQANREKAEAEKRSIESQRNYLIDAAITMTASKMQPYSLESTLLDFKRNYKFDVNENGISVIDQKTGTPLLDENGNNKSVDAIFKEWSKDNLWRFQSTSQGGANINNAGEGQGNAEFTEFTKIAERLKTRQELTKEEMEFFQKNRTKILLSFM